MNEAQSHASLLLLAVMGAPWLIDRLFTWLDDRAETRSAIDRRVTYAAWSVRHGKNVAHYKRMGASAGFIKGYQEGFDYYPPF